MLLGMPCPCCAWGMFAETRMDGRIPCYHMKARGVVVAARERQLQQPTGPNGGQGR